MKSTGGTVALRVYPAKGLRKELSKILRKISFKRQSNLDGTGRQKIKIAVFVHFRLLDFQLDSVFWNSFSEKLSTKTLMEENSAIGHFGI